MASPVLDGQRLDTKVTSRLYERLVPSRQCDSPPHGELQIRRIAGGQSLRSRKRQNLPKRAGLRFGVGHDRQTTQEFEVRRDLRAAGALVTLGSYGAWSVQYGGSTAVTSIVRRSTRRARWND